VVCGGPRAVLAAGAARGLSRLTGTLSRKQLPKSYLVTGRRGRGTGPAAGPGSAPGAIPASSDGNIRIQLALRSRRCVLAGAAGQASGHAPLAVITPAMNGPVSRAWDTLHRLLTVHTPVARFPEG
jgi:hypothetical protein